MANDLICHVYVMKPPSTPKSRGGVWKAPVPVNKWISRHRHGLERAWVPRVLSSGLALYLFSGAVPESYPVIINW